MLLAVAGNAQTRQYTPPRTPDGQPDLQGIWTNATVTPLERPANLAGKEFFTPAEARQYEKDTIERNNADRRDGGAQADLTRAYNDAWYDRGTRVVETLRTSLVIDPPDGRIPRKASAPTGPLLGFGRPPEGPEDRSLAERCILWPTAGPPMMPSFYNNNYQIVQGPGYVTILVEMIHDARIIPLDNRPHVDPGIRQWMGDPRGHWEGNTLVVETTNFNDKTRFQRSSQGMKLVERFTRTAPDTIMYEFTVDDPSSFTKPWTAQIPMKRTEGPLFEYACNEGNYAMTDMLAGARADKKSSYCSGSLLAPCLAAVLGRAGGRDAQLGFFQELGFLVGEHHAVHHRQVAEHRDHPQHRRHAVEQRADDQQHHALGPFHEADLALGNRVFRPRAGIADHHRGGHHQRRQHHVKGPVDRSVPDQQAHQQRQIRIAVQHRIEEAAEARDAIGFAGHAAVHHVEQSRADDHHAGPAELSGGQQDSRADVDHQAQEREHVGMDPGERQPAHNQPDDFVAGPADRVECSSSTTSPPL